MKWIRMNYYYYYLITNEYYYYLIETKWLLEKILTWALNNPTIADTTQNQPTNQQHDPWQLISID